MKAHRLSANYVAELDFVEQIMGDDVSEVLVMFVTVDNLGTTRNISENKKQYKIRQIENESTCEVEKDYQGLFK